MSRVSRSILLTKVTIGMSRRRQTSKSFKSARLDALGGVDDHDGAVDRRKRSIGVVGKVLVAGRVEEVEDMVAIFEGHHRGDDRDAALTLDLHPVRAGLDLVLLGLHLARKLDRAAEEQELFSQRRLAGIGVRDDRKGAAAGDRLFDFLCHVRNPVRCRASNKARLRALAHGFGNILRLWDRGLRAGLEAGERAGDGGAAQRILQLHAVCQRRGEIAAERVARADRVDRLDLQPLRFRMPPWTAAATPAAPSVTTMVGRFRRANSRMRGAAVGGRRAPELGIGVELGLVGDDIVGQLQELGRFGPERRGVEDRDRADALGFLQRGPDRRIGISCWRRSQSPFSRCAFLTSPGTSEPLAPGTTAMTFSPSLATRIIAVPVVAWDSRTPDRSTRPSRRQRQRLVGKGVLPDRAHHAHLAAGALGGQRLVGALAAGRGLEAVAGHGFAGLRQAADIGDEVEIDRADDGDHELEASAMSLRETP